MRILAALALSAYALTASADERRAAVPLLERPPAYLLPPVAPLAAGPKSVRIPGGWPTPGLVVFGVGTAAALVVALSGGKPARVHASVGNAPPAAVAGRDPKKGSDLGTRMPVLRLKF